VVRVDTVDQVDEILDRTKMKRESRFFFSGPFLFSLCLSRLNEKRKRDRREISRKRLWDGHRRVGVKDSGLARCEVCLLKRLPSCQSRLGK
jgi:hypothetical protein